MSPRRFSEDELSALDAVVEKTRTMHRLAQQKQLRELDLMLSGLPAQMSEKEIAKAAKLLDTKIRAESRNALYIEQQSIEEVFRILGIGDPATVRASYRNYLDDIGAIRELFDLPRIPPEEYEKLFVRNMRGYAAAHDLSLNEAMVKAKGNAAALAKNAVGAEMSMVRFGSKVLAFKDSGAKKYRRVPSGSSCAACHLIADRTYYTEQLAPLHDWCDCDVLPLLSSEQASDYSDPSTMIVARKTKIYKKKKGGKEALAAAKPKVTKDEKYGERIAGFIPKPESFIPKDAA